MSAPGQLRPPLLPNVTDAAKERLEMMPAIASRLAEMAEGKAPKALVWPWAIYMWKPAEAVVPSLQWGRVTHVGAKGLRLTPSVLASVPWSWVLAIVTKATLDAREVTVMCYSTEASSIEGWEILLKHQAGMREKYLNNIEARYRARVASTVSGANLLEQARSFDGPHLFLEASALGEAR